MKPNPIDMMVFLEVVEARTFTAAADRLGRTKSAVSQAVARLEADLDCRLLLRSTRALSLTEAGARFYAHCRDVRQAYEAGLADLRTDLADPAGVLTVTAPHALSAPLMVPAIARFRAEHPNMRVRLVAEDAPIDLIEARIDLSVRVGHPKEQAARITRLGTLRESLYASPDAIAGHGGAPADLAALAAWDHIANDWQGDPVTYATDDGARLRVKPHIRCNALPDILRLAELGLGVALLPDLAARESVAKDALTRLFEICDTPVHSMHNFATRPPKKVVAFVKLLRGELQKSEALGRSG